MDVDEPNAKPHVSALPASSADFQYTCHIVRPHRRQEARASRAPEVADRLIKGVLTSIYTFTRQGNLQGADTRKAPVDTTRRRRPYSYRATRRTSRRARGQHPLGNSHLLLIHHDNPLHRKDFNSDLYHKALALPESTLQGQRRRTLLH